MRRVPSVRIGVVLGVGLGILLSVVVSFAGALIYLRTTGLGTGLGTGAEPGGVETTAARAARRFAVPAATRALRNPVPVSAEALADGMAHYADHCASCHANDGSGNTEMGQGFYPKAPDMRLAATQELTDGELFHVIEQGIRFTGMPAWRTGTSAGEESSWRLVQFLRHLPQLTPAELDAMRARNPRSPDDIRHEIEEDSFLNQGVLP